MLTPKIMINENSTREEVLEHVKQDGRYLAYASKNLQQDKEVVMEAVKQNGLALYHVPIILRDDKEIVMEAVKQNGKALEYTSAKLCDDNDVVMEAVKQNGCALKCASKKLCSNKNIVIEAVKQDENAFRYASEELRSDKAVVLEAVKENGNALKFASEELRNDKEVVIAAVKQEPFALQHASHAIQDNIYDIIVEDYLSGADFANKPQVLKVKTPIGYLTVEEKGAESEYPGVYVSLSHNGETPDASNMIACVEYNNTFGNIQTCTYSENQDTPVLVKHWNAEVKYYELMYFFDRKDGGSKYIKTSLNLKDLDEDDFLQKLVDMGLLEQELTQNIICIEKIDKKTYLDMTGLSHNWI